MFHNPQMLLSAYKNTNDFNISLKCFFTQSEIFLCVYGSPEGQITFFFPFFSGDPFVKMFFYLVWSSLGSKHRKQKLLKNFI